MKNQKPCEIKQKKSGYHGSKLFYSKQISHQPSINSKVAVSLQQDQKSNISIPEYSSHSFAKQNKIYNSPVNINNQSIKPTHQTIFSFREILEKTIDLAQKETSIYNQIFQNTFSPLKQADHNTLNRTPLKLINTNKLNNTPKLNQTNENLCPKSKTSIPSFYNALLKQRKQQSLECHEKINLRNLQSTGIVTMSEQYQKYQTKLSESKKQIGYKNSESLIQQFDVEYPNAEIDVRISKLSNKIEQLKMNAGLQDRQEQIFKRINNYENNQEYLKSKIHQYCGSIIQLAKKLQDYLITIVDATDIWIFAEQQLQHHDKSNRHNLEIQMISQRIKNLANIVQSQQKNKIQIQIELFMFENRINQLQKQSENDCKNNSTANISKTIEKIYQISQGLNNLYQMQQIKLKENEERYQHFKQ